MPASPGAGGRGVGSKRRVCRGIGYGCRITSRSSGYPWGYTRWGVPATGHRAVGAGPRLGRVLRRGRRCAIPRQRGTREQAGAVRAVPGWPCRTTPGRGRGGGGAAGAGVSCSCGWPVTRASHVASGIPTERAIPRR